MRVERILVPTDFSDDANHAFEFAARMARQFDAEVHLVHIAADASLLSYTYPSAGLNLDRRHFEAAQKAMEKLAPREIEGVRLNKVVKEGDVVPALLEMIRDEHIDLLVMGKHGKRTPERWLLGSVTERLLRNVPIPLVTVAGPQLSATDLAIRRVMYATDLAEGSRHGINWARDLARAFGADLLIVHVMEKLGWIYDSGLIVGYPELNLDRVVDSTKRLLDEVLPPDQRGGVRVETLLLDGTPHTRILEAAEEHRADLLVMNMHGKSMLERALLGHTAERVIRAARVPVLSVPGEAAAEGQALPLRVPAVTLI